MSLERGTIVGYNADNLLVRFTMLDGTSIIDCEISCAALDNLVGAKWTSRILVDRVSQFVEHRQTIEELASQLYKVAPRDMKIVRIFSKHFPK
jgi:hypothetical protein